MSAADLVKISKCSDGDGYEVHQQVKEWMWVCVCVCFCFGHEHVKIIVLMVVKVWPSGNFEHLKHSYLEIGMEYEKLKFKIIFEHLRIIWKVSSSSLKRNFQKLPNEHKNNEFLLHWSNFPDGVMEYSAKPSSRIIIVSILCVFFSALVFFDSKILRGVVRVRCSHSSFSLRSKPWKCVNWHIKAKVFD